MAQIQPIVSQNVLQQNTNKIGILSSLDGIFNNMKQENKQAIVLGVSVLLVGFIASMLGSAISIWKATTSVIKDDKSSRLNTYMVYTDLTISVLSCLVSIVLVIVALFVNQKLLKKA